MQQEKIETKKETKKIIKWDNFDKEKNIDVF